MTKTKLKCIQKTKTESKFAVKLDTDLDLDLLYLSLLHEQRDYIQQSPRCSFNLKKQNKTRETIQYVTVRD